MGGGAHGTLAWLLFLLRRVSAGYAVDRAVAVGARRSGRGTSDACALFWRRLPPGHGRGRLTEDDRAARRTRRGHSGRCRARHGTPRAACPASTGGVRGGRAPGGRVDAAGADSLLHRPGSIRPVLLRDRGTQHPAGSAPLAHTSGTALSLLCSPARSVVGRPHTHEPSL